MMHYFIFNLRLNGTLNFTIKVEISEINVEKRLQRIFEFFIDYPQSHFYLYEE